MRMLCGSNARGANVVRVLVVVTILRAIKAAAVEDPTTLPAEVGRGYGFRSHHVNRRTNTNTKRAKSN